MDFLDLVHIDISHVQGALEICLAIVRGQAFIVTPSARTLFFTPLSISLVVMEGARDLLSRWYGCLESESESNR